MSSCLAVAANAVVEGEKFFGRVQNGFPNFSVDGVLGRQEGANVAFKEAADVLVVDIGKHFPRHDAQVAFALVAGIGGLEAGQSAAENIFNLFERETAAGVRQQDEFDFLGAIFL